ncbi:hypothetical protein GA0115249_102920 [Streptomyces sp. PpalLS-921]|nr:hypothetical protein GA0115249_102920 [Streptomyces sp. PpalLS-921]
MSMKRRICARYSRSSQWRSLRYPSASRPPANLRTSASMASPSVWTSSRLPSANSAR